MLLTRRNVLFGITALPASTLLAGRPLPGLTATVYNGYELHTALGAAGPGSTIMLAPGDYGDTGHFTLAVSDISVRVQSPLKTILRSPLVVRGSFIELDGLAFEQGLHLAGTGLLIASSIFQGKGLTVSGVNTEIVGCEFAGCTNQAIRVKGSAKNPRVHDNYIHDSQGSGNGHEAIQIGASMKDSNMMVGALVENNRIERCSAESEAISVKSSGNILRGNILRDCRANLVNRHGEGNTYENNTLERCYGIVIHDRGNRLLGNRLVNAVRHGIHIMGGNIPWNSTRQSGHPQACETYLAGNEGLLVIGRQFPGHKLPAVNTMVASHNGPIQLRAQQGTVLPA